MFEIISMARLERAFRHVREELRDVGLLDEGRGLDRIDVVRAALPSMGAMG